LRKEKEEKAVGRIQIKNAITILIAGKYRLEKQQRKKMQEEENYRKTEVELKWKKKRKW